jgi:hypothetical protein
MDEKRKKTEQERIEQVERELAAKPSTRLLLERIAYHRAKLAEEKARRERPLWRRLLPG